MNDLGWTLAWIAVQVSLVLIPVLGLHALANRRGPAPGAWVATLGLGMAAILPALAFLPESGRAVEAVASSTPRGPTDRAGGASKVEPSGDLTAPPAPSEAGRGLTFEGLRLAWDRIGRRASGPVARFRPWGKTVAVIALAGSAVGLARLLIGLWAVGLCRRRGRSVDDLRLIGLVEELRGSMGCTPEVELREVADLATPATAGWFRPVLLLPDDWRGWDESERRAVVAHELAHVVRGDYAAGLVARLAVVLNSYHPLVRWLAGRLHLEQELAADALGAQFAGGRSSYLLALSRLALRQDGRPSSWPARAFLPTRGTLIRRIKMLSDENQSKRDGTTWSRSNRLATALGLLALTIGVASWKAPARAADDPARPLAPIVKGTGILGGLPPFPVDYVPESRLGVYAFRPSATLRRSGMGGLSPLIRGMMAEDFGMFAEELKVDRSRPGFVKLHPEDIESVVGTFDIHSSENKNAANPKNNGRKLYALDLGEGGGLTARTVAPFDWLAFLRKWKVEVEEVREPRGVYHKIKWPELARRGIHLGIYLPDDRTIVYDNEETIKKLIAREAPSAPSYLRGAEWERVSRDLFALALNNRDDELAKRMNLGRAEDLPVLAFFKGVEGLTIGLADSDSLNPRAELTGREPQVAEAATRTIQTLLDLYRATIAANPGDPDELAAFAPMAKKFIAALQVGHEGRTATASAGGFGTFADLGAIIKAMAEDGSLEIGPEGPKAKAAKTEKDKNIEKR